MTAIARVPSTTTQISPANERVYRQSNLLGDWKGRWSKTNQPVEFKVVSITGNSAQIEYTHNGRTERGTGKVNGSTISFGNVTIGTGNGKNAAMVFAFGPAKMSAMLEKETAPTDQNRLVGTWIGNSVEDGVRATFQVLSINGRDAKVKCTVNGNSQEGMGDVYKNAVTFGKVQVSSDDGMRGKVTLPLGRKTLSVSVTKSVPPGTSSSVNRLA